MRYHLVSGGCGFVGRNMVTHLLTNTEDSVVMVDDLSVGISPAEWLQAEKQVFNLFMNPYKYLGRKEKI